MESKEARAKQKAYMHAYYLAHKEEALQKASEYHKAHPEGTRAAAKRYREAHPERTGAANKRWRAENQEHARRIVKEYNARLRQEVIVAYGGACSCCGESNARFLTLDQENAEKKKTRRGVSLYRWLINNGFPKAFRLLCFNCSHGRYRNGGSCPHSGSIAGARRERAEVFKAYGDRCLCCGEAQPHFLDIDHENGGGRALCRDKQEPVDLAPWLTKHSNPSGYRILCANCNRGRALNGGICPHHSGQTPKEAQVLVS